MQLAGYLDVSTDRPRVATFAIGDLTPEEEDELLHYLKYIRERKLRHDTPMQLHETLFTPTEAAVLTGLSLEAVNNAIDKKTISAVAGEEGGRLLDARALVSLSLERRLSDRIAPELRRQVFDALAGSPRNVVSLE
jgi:hypothetical protein